MLASSLWLLFFIRMSIHISRLWFVLAFLVFALGLAVSLLARQRLELNLQAEVWSETELAAVRTLLLKPLWMWVGLTLLTICMLAVTRGFILSLP